MRTHMADNGETLVTIAKKYRIGLSELAAVNQHIIHPNTNLVGSTINIPHLLTERDNRVTSPIPMCPPFEVPDFNETWIPTTSLGRWKKRITMS